MGRRRIFLNDIAGDDDAFPIDGKRVLVRKVLFRARLNNIMLAVGFLQLSSDEVNVKKKK